jgi:hypothetical protein
MLLMKQPHINLNGQFRDQLSENICGFEHLDLLSNF